MTDDEQEFMDDLRFRQRCDIIRARAFRAIEAHQGDRKKLEKTRACTQDDIDAISKELHLHPVCVKRRLEELGYVEAEVWVPKGVVNADLEKIKRALSDGRELTPAEIAARTKIPPKRVHMLLNDPMQSKRRDSTSPFRRTNLYGKKIRWSLKEKSNV